jgi:hypothetical protein
MDMDMDLTGESIRQSFEYFDELSRFESPHKEMVIRQLCHDWLDRAFDESWFRPDRQLHKMK